MYLASSAPKKERQISRPFSGVQRRWHVSEGMGGCIVLCCVAAEDAGYAELDWIGLDVII